MDKSLWNGVFIRKLRRYMKKIQLLILLCFAGLSCKKQYLGDLPDLGDISVNINGTLWEEKVQVAQNSGSSDYFTFAAYKYKKNDGIYTPMEEFFFEKVKKNTEVQRIFPVISGYFPQNPDSFYLYSSFYTNQDDGDVPCDGYAVWDTDSANNWIQITKQEGDYKEIWGNFSVTYIRGMSCAASPYADDTLRFRNGTFHFRFE